MFGALGHALQRSLRARGYAVRRKGKPGSGLTRPDFFDWPREGRALIERFDPHLVLIVFGGNDAITMRDRSGSFKDGIRWKDELRWNREYEARIERLVELYARPLPGPTAVKARRVIVLGPTNRKSPGARRRMERIRRLQRQAVARGGHAEWVDLHLLTTDPATGRYLKYGRDRRGKKVKYRYPDGVHLTRAGATALRNRLLPLVLDEPRTVGGGASCRLY